MADAVSVELQQLQNEILEAIARGAELKTIADLVCVRAERLAPGVLVRS